MVKDTPMKIESPLEDLGIPVPNNSVYAMTFNIDKTKIYGLSYPDAVFFIFDLKTRTTRKFKDIMTHKVYGGPETELAISSP